MTDDTRAQTQQDVLFRRHLMRAGNLVAQAVPLAATSIVITLPLSEQNTAYGVNVTPNWLTTFRVITKTTTSYTIEFGTPAPASATVDTSTFRQA